MNYTEILKNEYELDEKESETFFKPKVTIPENIKNDVKTKYKVYLKTIGNKIRVAGGNNKEERLNAIIDLIQLNKKEEEEDFFDYEDDDNIDLISGLAKSSSDQIKPSAKTQPQNSLNQNQQENSQIINANTTQSQENNNQQQQRQRNHDRNEHRRNDNNPNDRNRNNRHFQKDSNNRNNGPRKTSSGPHEGTQGQNRPQRFRSQEGGQSERRRGPTNNYLQKNNLKNSNQSENNKLDQNNENKTEDENRTEENKMERGRGRRGRGRSERSDQNERNERDGRGRGRGGRGGRGRGRGRGRGERAPHLGPRKSILNDTEDNQQEQNTGENNLVNDNQQQQQPQPPNRRGGYNYQNRRGGYNNQNRKGNYNKGRGGKYGYSHGPQGAQEDMQQPQQQPPINPNEITYKEEVAQPPRTIEITPELRHTLMLMDNQITPESTDEEILKTEWFHLDRLLNPLNEEDLQPGTLMNVPYLLVEFLIESFAIDQPYQIRHIEHKNFHDKQLMHLNMPFTIPLTFQTEGDKIQVGFYNLSNFSSDEMSELCSTVLTALSQRNMLSISINEVDRAFPFSYLEELSKELDFIYLYSTPTENEELETISFTIKIMIYNWSQEKEQAILGKINEMFKNSSIFECRKCGCTYSPSDGSKCLLTRHKGKQIPFPDSGEWEVFDQDEETGQPIVYVYYECCGEVEQDEPGCETTNIENGSHEPFEGGEETSTMAVETLPIYS